MLTGTGYRRNTPHPAKHFYKADFYTVSHRITLKESDYESEGRRFESCRARHRKSCKVSTFSLSPTLAYASLLAV